LARPLPLGGIVECIVKGALAFHGLDRATAAVEGEGIKGNHPAGQGVTIIFHCDAEGQDDSVDVGSRPRSQQAAAIGLRDAAQVGREPACPAADRSFALHDPLDRLDCEDHEARSGTGTGREAPKRRIVRSLRGLVSGILDVRFHGISLSEI
jgi:hypothetical protein